MSYHASGEVTLRHVVFGRTVAAPAVVFGDWIPDASRLHFFGRLDRSGAGFDLDVTDLGASGLTALLLTSPAFTATGEPDGTITFPFVLSDTLGFRSLTVGTSGSAATVDGRYVVPTTRETSELWLIRVEPRPDGPGPFPEVRTCTLRLTLPPGPPPWDAMKVDIHAAGDQGDVEATMTLARA